jgi:hypothetical protein
MEIIDSASEFKIEKPENQNQKNNRLIIFEWEKLNYYRISSLTLDPIRGPVEKELFGRMSPNSVYKARLRNTAEFTISKKEEKSDEIFIIALFTKKIESGR